MTQRERRDLSIQSTIEHSVALVGCPAPSCDIQSQQTGHSLVKLQLLRHLVNASGQPDDLWPILLDKALRMSQAVTQTLDLLADSPRQTLAWNANSSQFGQATNTAPGRIGQISGKFIF